MCLCGRIVSSRSSKSSQLSPRRYCQPVGRRAAVFDEIVARVPFQIGHAPGQPFGAGHGKQRAAGQRGPQHIMLALRPQCSTASYQMAGRRLTSKCGSQASKAVPVALRCGLTAQALLPASRGKSVISSSASSESWRRFVTLRSRSKSALSKQRAEQLAHLVVVDAGLNQLQQDAFVLLLADDQAAEAQQIADQQHGLLVPGCRHEAGGPHRQRAAGVLHAVVDPFAIGGQLVERVVVELIDFAIEIQVQPGAAEEAVRLQQLGLVGDQLGGTAAGHGPREQHLRGPVDGVHVAQPVQSSLPAGRRDMRHAVLVAGDRNSSPGMFERKRFHQRGGAFQAANRRASLSKSLGTQRRGM